jgi:ribonucleotide reductase alpha subunit
MNIKFLPNANKARIDREKIIEYLLCESHPDGWAKAAFFTKFGFTIEQWEVLAESLRKHGMNNPIVKTVESGYGVSYCVEGPIETPGGVRPNIRTVWIIEEGFTEPRLITAYPI